MAQFHRILWSEGLFITPHHFQQWDLFQRAEVAERIQISATFPWGVHSMEIDEENLARGTFRLLSFRGIFPGGGVVRSPEFDPPPPSTEFAESFDLKHDFLEIYLAVPSLRSGWPNTKLNEDADGGEELRYHARTVSVPDQNTGRDERSVQRAEQNLQILVGTDLRDNYETIPLARVQRSATGEFQLVPEFVPPLLALNASTYLGQLCRSLLERLSSRSTELAGRFTDAGINTKDITTANLRAFLQFSAINTIIPQLAHFREVGQIHPEQFYSAFASLVGTLCTFNPSRYHPRDIPPYNHLELGSLFKQLESMMVDLLDIKEVSHGYEVLPLVPSGEGRFQTNFQKESSLAPSTMLILSVSGEAVPEATAVGAISQGRLILSSSDRIDQKLSMSLPGLPLRHLPLPPPAIPRTQGTNYFQLDSIGSDWDAIKEAKNLVLQIPPDLRTLQYELLSLEGHA